MTNTKSRHGFTLIELSLSIAFIAVLSISIVLIITNTISSYHRGLTLNQLNTVGMDLVDDMRSSIQNASARSVVSECSNIYKGTNNDEDNCTNDGAKNFVSISRRANVEIGGKDEKDYPVFGAFCTGNYSYIWNTGYFFLASDYKVKNVSPATFTYTPSRSSETESNKAVTVEGFKLLKIKDKNRSVCISAVAKNYNNPTISNQFNISIENGDYSTLDEAPVDILDSSSSMAIYDIYSGAPAEGTSRNDLFYSVSFILGTINGGINVNSSGNYCATPSGLSTAEDFDYCAINKFNFAAQAVGG